MNTSTKIYTNKQKIRATITLLICLLLLIATNVVHKRNSDFVQQSFESIYLDRFIVNDYIFSIARLTENKKWKFDNIILDENLRIDDHSYDSIDELLSKYARTNFSQDETTYFAALKEKVHNLKSIEEHLTRTINIDERSEIAIDLNHKAQSAIDDLETLSDIQVVEARKLFDSSNKLIHNSYMIAQIEVVLLIVICTLIYALLTVTRSNLTTNTRLSGLN